MDLENGQLKESLNFIGRFCLDNKVKISVAESVTAGLLQVMLSTCEKAGLFYEGGLTAYSCAQKLTNLGIDRQECEKNEGVTMNIAELMALQIAQRFDTQLALGISGFASPIPEKGILELYAYSAIALNGEIVYAKRLEAVSENQIENQIHFAKDTIHLCARFLNHLR
ncbi:CinA family protein [Algoriphagus aquimarinus]|uniref:CinA family protein n=1 Tax=Algoriphagus aquimarinus TaxID=237018 RepID=UPI0030D6E063|tara:strand:+ start:157411 stop:157914 length:504 start_codon:yes stop_codon:yes gene_type:complete